MSDDESPRLSGELMDYVRSLDWNAEHHGPLPQDLDWLVEPTLHAFDRIFPDRANRRDLRAVVYHRGGNVVQFHYGQGVNAVRVPVPAATVADRSELAVLAHLRRFAREQGLYAAPLDWGPATKTIPEWAEDMDVALSGLRPLVPRAIRDAVERYAGAVRTGDQIALRVTEYSMLAEILTHTRPAGVHAIDLDDQTERSE